MAENEDVMSTVQTEAEYIEEMRNTMNAKMGREIDAGFLAFVLMLEYIFKIYLCVKQRNLCKISTKFPDHFKGFVEEETFQRSRSYKIDVVEYQIGSASYYMLLKLVLLALEQKYDLFPYCTILQYLSMIHIGFDTCGLIIIDLPRKVYRTFVVHENHGFNNQSPGVFIYDLSEKIFIRICIIALFVPIIHDVNLLTLVELILPVYFLLVMTFMMIDSFTSLYSRKYISLADGLLKERLERLARSVGFPPSKLFILEESKNSNYLTSYFHGFWITKHIVLSDTLLQGCVRYDDKNANPTKPTECDVDEAEGVLAHELGHWNYNHFIKMFTVKILYCTLSVGLLLFIFAGNIFPGNFSPIVRLLHLSLPIYFMVVQHGIKRLSRRFEFEADTFAVNLGVGYGRQLRSALIKIAKANLSFPILDPTYSEWFDSKPDPVKRIQAIDLAIQKFL